MDLLEALVDGWLLWAGVGEIANNLPASVLLALEDVHTRLERADGSDRTGLRFIQCPNQPDYCNITVDQDLSQIKPVVGAMRFVGQQAVQRSAHVVVSSIRNLAELITKLFGEDAADLIRLASVISLCPGVKFRANSLNSVRIQRPRGRDQASNRVAKTARRIIALMMG